MQEQVRQRLAELRSELESGQRMLAELDARRAELQQTLLRIAGAAQVLEELLSGAGEAPGAPSSGVPSAGGVPPGDVPAAGNGQPVAAGVP